MKKPTMQKSLRLNRESVRNLSNDALIVVGGGASNLGFGCGKTSAFTPCGCDTIPTMVPTQCSA